MSEIPQSEQQPVIEFAEFETPTPDVNVEVSQPTSTSNERSHRIRNLIGLPLAATAALLLSNGDGVPPKPDMSCADIHDDAFQPHVGARAGRLPGIGLDNHLLPTKDMTPVTNKITGDILTLNDQPVLKKVLGTVSVHGDSLDGIPKDMPETYRQALANILSDDEIKAITCRTDRLTVHEVSELDVTMDQYTLKQPKQTPEEIKEDGLNKPEGIDLYFVTKDNRDYPDERSVMYLLRHEGAHGIRARVQNGGKNPEAVALYRQYDELYRQNATMAVEEYRSLHGAEMINRLDKIDQIFKSLHVVDGDTVPVESKQAVSLAVSLLKERIKRPNGLADVAVHDDKGPYKTQEVSLNYLHEMLKDSYMKATGVSEDDMPFAFDPEQFDLSDAEGHPQFGEAEQDMYEFVKPRFVLEQTMPGSPKRNGHPEDSDEDVTSLWSITDDVDEDQFGRLVATVPEAYRSVNLQKLALARKLRFTIKPSDIATNGEADDPASDAAAVSISGAHK